MTAPSNDLPILKYTEAADDEPVQDWFNLFEHHATAASWSEREMITNFTDYISGEAFKFYLTHIFENDESWQKIREEMIARFNDYDKDFLITDHLHTTTLGRHSPRLFLKKRGVPPGFSSRKSAFPKSWHQHTTRDVTHPTDAFHVSSRIHGPPPGFLRRSSSKAPNGHYSCDKDALFMVDQLTHGENTKQRQDDSKSENQSARIGAAYSPSCRLGPPPGFPSLGSFVTHNVHLTSSTLTMVGIKLRSSDDATPSPELTTQIHAPEQLASLVAQKEGHSQLKRNRTTPVAVLPSNVQPPETPNTEGSDASNVACYQAQEPLIVSHEEEAPDELSVNSECFLSQEFISTAPQTCQNLYFQPGDATSHVVPSCSGDQSKNQTYSEANHTSNLVHSCLSEASVINHVTEAFEEQASNDGAPPTMPDKQETCSPCIICLQDASNLKVNECPIPEGLPLQPSPEQHQQSKHSQARNLMRQQNRLQRRHRRTRNLTEVHSPIEEHRKIRSRNQRPIQDVRHLRTKESHQRHSLPQLLHRLHHHRKRRERRGSTACTPQALRHFVTVCQKARKQEAPESHHSRRKIQHPRNTSRRCNNAFQPCLVPRTVQAVLPVSTCGALYPERNSQARPPESSQISPDCPLGLEDLVKLWNSVGT